MLCGGGYFFYVGSGLAFYPDEEGVELPSQADAEAEGSRFPGAIGPRSGEGSSRTRPSARCCHRGQNSVRPGFSGCVALRG
ncbi:DUF6894 family protein [Bradyrhizobium arachidis]|uniref:DUF6894 family protein n=1 Tax=Bradyrhizobium TaxID=374 RepID=UPI003D323E40